MAQPRNHPAGVPVRHPQALAVPAIVFWPQTPGEALSLDDLATAPRAFASASPSDERGYAPGSIIYGTDGSTWKVNASGIPVRQAEDLAAVTDAQADATQAIADAAAAQADATTAISAAGAAQTQANQASEHLIPMAVLGPWAFDGDGARTNGGGMVGTTPTLTEASNGQAKVENGGVFGNLSAVNAGYAATYQLFPDAPVAEADFAYFGATGKFCEIAFDMATVATYDAAGVLTWQYWNGSAWTTLTIAHDGTSASTDGGTLAFGRDGAITFVPPAGWAQNSVNGVTLYWIRVGIAAGKAANMTAIPITNAKNHEIVTPNGGFVVRQAGTLTTLRLCDSAATLHTANDVNFLLFNYTSGAGLALVFSQDVRCQRYTGLSLALGSGDVLGVVVTQEDGTNEPSNVMLELGVTIA